MAEGNSVMSSANERNEIAGLIEAADQLLNKMLADVLPRRREVAEIVVAELRALHVQFCELFEELSERRKEEIQRYLAEQPRVCAHCLRTLTMNEAQLTQHITAAAKAAAWSGWPEDEFKDKMRRLLAPGDRIEFVGPGAVTVLRKDGATVTIWRRES